MLNVQITNEVYELPEGWHEVTVNKFIALSNIQDNADLYDFNFKLLSVLLDCPEQEIRDALTDSKGMLQLINSVQWVNEPMQNSTICKLEGYKIDTNYKELTFGDWISIETLIKADKNQAIIAVLTVLFKDKGGEFNQDTQTQAEHIGNLIVTGTIEPFESFMKFRANIYLMYQGLFQMSKSEKQDELDVELEKRAGINKSFDMSKWLWLMMVDKLAKELNYIPEQIYKMNLFAALNWTAMFKEKEDYIEEQQKRQRQNNKV